MRKDPENASLDAQVHAALENLSQVANFTVIKMPDGTSNVYLGGQTPLVLGNQQFGVSANLSAQNTVIYDSQGNDITSQITSGSLGALLSEKNTTLPGYSSSLNTLAQSFADAVNGALAQGEHPDRQSAWRKTCLPTMRRWARHTRSR